MSEQHSSGQTLIELLVILLPIALSFIFGRIFFRYVGWWGVLPGVVFGFGSVALLSYVLIRFFDLRGSRGRRSLDS
jgi:hypothetical protein